MMRTTPPGGGGCRYRVGSVGQLQRGGGRERAVAGPLASRTLSGKGRGLADRAYCGRCVGPDDEEDDRAAGQCEDSRCRKNGRRPTAPCMMLAHRVLSSVRCPVRRPCQTFASMARVDRRKLIPP